MNNGLSTTATQYSYATWESSFADTPTWRAPIGQEGGNNAGVHGTLYLVPFKIMRPIVVDGLDAEILNIASSPLTLFVCIYESVPGQYRPGRRRSMATLDGITTSGHKAALIPAEVYEPGLYWQGVMHLSPTSATQQTRTRQSTSTVQGQWWMTNDHGTGAGPNLAAGNDGMAWTQAGLTEPPAMFGGTMRNESNNPNGAAFVAMRVRNAG